MDESGKNGHEGNEFEETTTTLDVETFQDQKFPFLANLH